MFLNPLVIKDLRDLCQAYKSRLISLETYNYKLWDIAQKITSLEEKKLRTFLMEEEAHLDSIMFTTEEELIFEKSLDVVNEIENQINMLEEKRDRE